MGKGIAIFILFSSTLLTAQDKTFTAEVGGDTILFGNPVEIRFLARNLIGQMEIPKLEGVNIVGGPNHSSTMQVMNGVVSRSESSSLFVQPLEEGRIYIPPASFATSDSTWQTPPREIVVLANPGKVQENYAVPGDNTLIPRQEPRKKLKVTKI